MIATETDHPYIVSSASSLLPGHIKHQATNIILHPFGLGHEVVGRRSIGCGRHFGTHKNHLKVPVQCSSLYANPLDAFLWMATDRRYMTLREPDFLLQVEMELTDHVTTRCFKCSLDEFVVKLDLDNTHPDVASGALNKKLFAVMWYRSDIREQQRNRLVVTIRRNKCILDVDPLFTILPNSIEKKQQQYNMLFETKWSKVLFIFAACTDETTRDNIVANVSSILSKYGNQTRTAVCCDFYADVKRLIVTTTWLTAYHYGCAKLIVAAYKDVVIVLPHQHVWSIDENDIVVERLTDGIDRPNQLLWINVRKSLLRICLAFHSFDLPVYVLLEIFDWFDIAWLFPRLIKVETIEMMLQSIRRVKGPK